MKYEVVLYWSQEDDRFIAVMPELPGCMADGESPEDALAKVQIVAKEWIEVAKDIGRPVPEPRGRLMYA